MEEISSTKVFGGWNRRYKHDSSECGCPMTFTVFYPPGCDQATVPVIYFLSGLTCTDENFIQKSGAQRVAAQLNIALIAPDTSPRGLGIEGEDDSWDFGTGAGFYLDATAEKWRSYRMYSYITKELPAVLKANTTNLDLANASVMGHSMGGHGALTIALKNPGMFKSVSAFSPICNPINCPWGQKAFGGYLGSDEAQWKQYDASELLKAYSGPTIPILVDTGSADNFLKAGQLLPEALAAAHAADGAAVRLDMRLQDGYDHSYFFIATFMEDHLRMHALALGIAPGL